MKIATCQERLNELFDSDPRNDTAIASALGVAKQTLSAWRNGSRSPKKTMLIKITEMFHVSIEWLMGFSVEKDGTDYRLAELPKSELITKIIINMTPEDYVTVMDALTRTEKRMKEEGKL